MANPTAVLETSLGSMTVELFTDKMPVTAGNFIDLAKQMVDMMHEPYFGRQETEFRKGHPDLVEEMELSYLSANLDAVAFHDSIVVFDKKRRNLPMNELR